MKLTEKKLREMVRGMLKEQSEELFDISLSKSQLIMIANALKTELTSGKREKSKEGDTVLRDLVSTFEQKLRSGEEERHRVRSSIKGSDIGGEEF